jgi:thioredoxin reductase (NADPH)
MAKPTLLTVDDDPNVLKAIERDLRARYGEKYRVLRANSGDAGLEILRELRVRNDAVALLLADQRMPQMDGIGFLNEAREVYPDGKRALLTAYADTLPTVYRFESSETEPALYPFRCRVTDFAART